jgi:integrase/recombinase XerD
MSVDELLDEWALWQRSGDLSERTVKDRVKTVATFARTVPDVLACDWRPLAEYVSRPGLAPASRHTYRAQLRAFYQWLHAMGYREDDPTAKLPRIKRPQNRPKPVTTTELETLLRRCYGRRLRMMIVLAAYQGLRVHEIAKLRGEDVQGDQLRVLGKGGTDLLVPLHPVIADQVRHWPARGWWFPSLDPAQPVTAGSVSRAVSDAFSEAGIPAGTCHRLRHWYATETLKSSGGNIRVVQELLRHRQLATTAIYCEVLASEQRAAVDGLPITGG